MNNRFRLCISALTVFLVLLAPSLAFAQETASAIRVSIFGPDANPLPGVDVTITDTRTGRVRAGQSNESGLVLVRGLPVGGPYSVETASASYTNQLVSDINLALGDTYSVVLQLSGSAMEEVVVTGSQLNVAEVAVGPSAIFDLTDLAGFALRQSQHQRHHPAGSPHLYRPGPRRHRRGSVQRCKPPLQQPHGGRHSPQRRLRTERATAIPPSACRFPTTPSTVSRSNWRR